MQGPLQRQVLQIHGYRLEIDIPQQRHQLAHARLETGHHFYILMSRATVILLETMKIYGQLSERNCKILVRVPFKMCGNIGVVEICRQAQP
ncbi:hypothetical protein HCU01_36920 [Halomonas cupida]|uniref:Uncharacterized protein n=1 Tax=Halomonas cupida TaxID=44933 RepID=A0ABQ0WK07_9GAMM|nr:hypothetical protein HCU01_36920 [Halomonas cupida]